MAAERIMSSSSSCGSLQDVGDVDDNKRNSTARDVKDAKNAGGGAAVTSNKKEAKKTKSTKLDRRDPQRFFGEGINFKAKLIGVRDVPQARGERMAHEALQELKIQKRTSGEHKQKININISLEGLKIRDEKTKDILFLHPVHKISFISQDAADNRAFGYIYGSPDNVHTFYAIKTEKAAHQLVMCMKNLFQIAYEMKKKEIEQWRMQQVQQQQFDNGAQTNHSPSTSLGSSNSNDYASISDGSAASRQNDVQFPMSISSDSSSNSSSIGVSDSVSNGSHSDNRSSGSLWPTERPNVVATDSGAELLLDLTMDESMRNANFTAAAVKNFGANPVHQPQTHHDPFFSDPWGYLSSISDSNDDNNANVDPFLVTPNASNTPALTNSFFAASTPSAADFSRFPTTDPFNTNFVTMPFSNCASTPATTFPISPVPIVTANWDPSSVNPQPDVAMEDKYAALADIIVSSAVTSSSTDDDIYGIRQPFDGSSTESSAADSHSGSTGSTADLATAFATVSTSDDPLLGSSFSNNTPADSWYQVATSPPQATISPFVFSDLDPLGKDRPYVDKKDFFQDVKNPPKKVLKDLVAENSFDLGGDLATATEHSFGRHQMPSDPFTSSYSDDDDDDSTTESTLPPPTIPPPLPPPLSLRKRSPSPASSLEDSSMQDSSSNSSRGTASPTADFAPPPPPPRPQMMLLPPPPALPHKHQVQQHPPLNRRDASPFAKDKNIASVTSPYNKSETDNFNVNATDGSRLSSPPIPIPGRRGRSPMAATSSSSTSMSSAASSITSTCSTNIPRGNSNIHHSSLATSLPSPVPDPNNNPMDRRRRTTASPARQSGDFGFWTGGLTTSNMNVTGSPTTLWSTGGGVELHQNELANAFATTTANNNRVPSQLINVGNPFTSAKESVFLNPPPQSNSTRRQGISRRAGTKEDIFHKEEDPFADDEFFAILKSHNAQNAKSPELVSTPNLNNAAVWSGSFGEKLNKNI